MTMMTLLLILKRLPHPPVQNRKGRGGGRKALRGLSAVYLSRGERGRLKERHTYSRNMKLDSKRNRGRTVLLLLLKEEKFIRRLNDNLNL